MSHAAPESQPVTAELAEFVPDHHTEALRAAALVYQGTRESPFVILRLADQLEPWLLGTRPVPGGGHSPLASIEALLAKSIENQEKIMAAIDNLAAADTALKTEVTTALADFAAAITAANSANDPAIQAVADDMNAMVTQIQGADPATPAAPPADGSGTADAGTPAS